ncbi:MAG: sigma-70 family RNA polymerase sigma factor [Candidatus Aminicenantes bacterium]|nr:sigma-70 family RNA polymerase sigma factor [Candidatus Aminicenantes bacterium]
MNGQRMENLELIQNAQQGNQEAFYMLFENNKKMVFGLAFKYTKNKQDAEDILQETFIKALNNLNQFQTKKSSSFSSWLYRIGVNCSIDFLRDKQRIRKSLSDWETMDRTNPDERITDPEKKASREDLKKKIELILEDMPPRQKMAFVLKHYQQLKIKEIAEFMDCSEGSVKKQLFRAVGSLKNSLKKIVWEKEYEL